MICRGWVPERPKGADCKSVVTDYDGSNPSPSTIFYLREWRNWQTRTVQVRVRATSCRFKSCFPHQTNIIRTWFSLWEMGSDYLFISTDTKTPTFRMALSSVPNPNREDRERRKSAIRKTGKAAPIIGELPCLLLCYSASCGAFTLFAFSICCAFHSANSRCPSSLS